VQAIAAVRSNHLRPVGARYRRPPFSLVSYTEQQRRDKRGFGGKKTFSPVNKKIRAEGDRFRKCTFWPRLTLLGGESPDTSEAPTSEEPDALLAAPWMRFTRSLSSIETRWKCDLEIRSSRTASKWRAFRNPVTDISILLRRCWEWERLKPWRYNWLLRLLRLRRFRRLCLQFLNLLLSCANRFYEFISF
jgi:hypothetical protein